MGPSLRQEDIFMKKAISVALASAMVMGLGVNAFADISYNTGAGTEEVDL